MSDQKKMTWTALAGALQITRGRLHELRSEPDSPGDSMDVEEWRSYLEERGSRASSPEIEQARLALIVERKKGVALDNEKKAQALAIEAGELIRVRDLAEEIQNIMASLVLEARGHMGRHRYEAYRASVKRTLGKFCTAHGGDPALSTRSFDEVDKIEPRHEADPERWT